MANFLFPRPKRTASLLACAVLVLCGCGPIKDRFTLTEKDVDSTGASSVGGGFAWSAGNLGSTINGHGLPDHAITFVIIHKSADGKTQLIWPDFIYGNDQANAAALGETVVFAAQLPDGKMVLMADKPGEVPLAISPAVLRLAAKRLGSSIIIPNQDYEFTKVRQPPDRIWLQCQQVSNQYFPQQQQPVLELNTNDLANVIAETKAKGKMLKAGRFDYIAEDGVPCAITSADVQTLGIPGVGINGMAKPAIYRTTSYMPQQERLGNGTALMDTSNNCAYFSTVHEPARILKVALGDTPATAPMVVGAVTLEGDENNTFDSVMDARGGYAYFATDFPGHVVKIALGERNQPPYRVGSVLINPEENVRAGVMDEITGNLYFHVKGGLYALHPGAGAAAPRIISHLDLGRDGTDISCAVADSLNHFAYLGIDGSAIEKVALTSNGQSRLVGQLKLDASSGDLRGAIIDPEAGFAWFTGDSGYIEKISLGHGNDIPKLVATLQVEPQFDYLENTFGKDNEGYAYYGTMEGGKAGDPVERIEAIVKVALGTGAAAPRMVSYLPLPRGYTITSGVVDPVHRILVVGISFAGDDPADACYKIVKCSLGHDIAAPAIVSEVKLAK